MSLKSVAFCPLGQSPAGPVMSALRYFRDEMEAAVDKTRVRPKPGHTDLQLVELAI